MGDNLVGVAQTLENSREAIASLSLTEE